MIIDYEGVVHLDSAQCDRRTVHNKPSEFLNFMHTPFSFSSDDYDVGLYEIQVPCTWHNVPEGQFCAAYEGTKMVTDLFTVASGCYASIDELIACINSYFNPESNMLARVDSIAVTAVTADVRLMPPRLSYVKEMDKVAAISGTIKGREGKENTAHIAVSKELAVILGFSRRYLHAGSCDPNEKDTSLMIQSMDHPITVALVHDNRMADIHMATLPPALNASVPRLYVRSNLVKHSGSNSRQLMRVIPAYEGKFGEIITFTFDRPIFAPLSHSYFDRIDLRITDSQGREIPFTSGNVVATLEFRKKSDGYF